MIEIISRPIEVQVVLESVRDPSAGGIDLFVGTTRNHSKGLNVRYLEYEAYEQMALGEMNRIARAAVEKWKLCKLSIVHRVGRVEIGEASVAIAVSAHHRSEAFDACRYTIDALKQDVPIWKKEYFLDGEVWVGPASRHDTLP